MPGLMKVMIVVGMVVLVTGGTGVLVWADPGIGHDSYGKSHHSGMEYGDGDYEGMGHHGGLSPLAMKEPLGLSDEQVNRLQPLEMEYRKTMIQNEADLHVAMVDMGTLLDAKTPDREAIARKIDEIVMLQKNMMLYRVDAFLELKKTLTPEQYEEFRSRLRAQMEGMADHGGELPTRMKGHGDESGMHHGEGSQMETQHP